MTTQRILAHGAVARPDLRAVPAILAETLTGLTAALAGLPEAFTRLAAVLAGPAAALARLIAPARLAAPFPSVGLAAVPAGLTALAATGLAFAQGNGVPDPGFPETDDIPSSLMTFFVTSEPIGDGGNLGGLEGADAHCQSLAAAVGQGHKNWRAYLSTQERPGQPAVNARDRIGDGPWYHSKARILDYLNRRLNRPLIKSQIHGDTLLEAQRGSNMSKQFALTEHGELVNGIGDPLPTLHALLTGSRTDGRAYPPGEDRTCDNWTSNGEGAAQFGHSDRIGGGNQSWNSAGTTTGCSQDDLVASGGAGLFYCFAID